MQFSASPPDHDELLAGLKSGNEAAFRKIYEKFWSPLYAVAYNHLRERMVAEEMVQELFTKLWLKRDQLNIHTSLQAYLYKAIRHLIYDHIDKQQVRQRVHEEMLSQGSEASYMTEETLDFQELQVRLAQAVDQLPQPAQAVFKMSRQEYLSPKEIAGRLNVSSKAVEYHLTRALRILRLRLKDFVLFISLCQMLG
ncbi:RNA polymerase sigma-70 factor [Dyadobacter fermentans]|uniref:RNA polymerase, sigma-24 subunit, ECF subfamily n=1 Tax=Dyadobacter fermentans (strain ATCC 700827 / DSM 18053 / CIP 107007 / KCTC 52180 / NS114) TaxID=471854 RepID=C6W263_DYAFD|nr:RNA polymerase sigma-70 factor [Dyadobacter fermentans]ACT92036.1 RNA polymerase, sigma-24 subunit, ECF subfamily [Dyadobacter fermentans DSM 18053]